MHPQPVTPRFDQARHPEGGQVTRRLGLRDLERLVNVADADFALQEQAEDPQPRAVAERFEDGLESDER